MSQRPPLSNEDLAMLSAYLDGALSEQEQAVLQARLEHDEVLRTELESLRRTVALLRRLPTLPAPRDFTLDPAVFGNNTTATAQPNTGTVLLPFPGGQLLRFATALGAVAAAVVLAVALIFLLGQDETGSDDTNNVAMDVGTPTPEAVVQRNMTAVDQEEPTNTPIGTASSPPTQPPTAIPEVVVTVETTQVPQGFPATINGRMATATVGAVGADSTALPGVPTDNSTERSATTDDDSAVANEADVMAAGAGANAPAITPTLMIQPATTATKADITSDADAEQSTFDEPPSAVESEAPARTATPEDITDVAEVAEEAALDGAMPEAESAMDTEMPSAEEDAPLNDEADADFADTADLSAADEVGPPSAAPGFDAADRLRSNSTAVLNTLRALSDRIFEVLWSYAR